MVETLNGKLLEYTGKVQPKLGESLGNFYILICPVQN